jgi:hypothetical protein
MKVAIALSALGIVNLVQCALSIPLINSTRLDQYYELGDSECGEKEFAKHKCDEQSNRNYGCSEKIGCWRSDPNFPKKWCWPIVKFLIGTQNFTWWAAGIAKCPECACKKKGCADCGTYKHTYDCLQVARLNDGDVFRPKLADKPGSNNIKYMQNEHRFVRCEDPDLHNYGYRFDPTGADIQKKNGE